MTVSTTQPRYQYTGNGATTAFAFPPVFIAAADLAVTLNDTGGNPVACALNGAGTYDFTVNGTQDPTTGEYLAGATVTFNTAPPGGWLVTLFRAPAETQTLTLPAIGALPPAGIATNFDKLVMMIQALDDKLSRTILAPQNEPYPSSLPLPVRASRANTVLGFDASGNIELLANPIVPTAPIVSTVAGVVTMVRTSDSNNNLSQLANWIVYKPDGTLLNLAGSTTQGLQEAINYAIAFGYDLVVRGGMTKPASAPGAFDGQNPAIINCTTTVNFGPMQYGRIDITDVTINSTAAVGVQFDSCLGVTVNLCDGGQIVVGPNAVALLFKPTNPLPQDSLFGIGIGGTCHFHIGSTVVPTGGTGTCIVFDHSLGPIQQSNEFNFSEVNGGAVGIQIKDGTFGVVGNTVFGYNIHGQTSQSIEVLQSAANANTVGGNKWFVDLYPAPGGVAIDSWAAGGGDYFLVTGIGAPSPLDIKWETSADGNIIDLSRSSAFTVNVQDLSTSGGNLVRSHEDYVDADLNGTNQTNLVTATWTKVQWTNFNVNTNAVNSTFSGALARWTPGIPGVALIEAQIKWATEIDGTLMRVGIYKNGALMRGGESVLEAKTAAAQDVHISRLVRIAAATDYFEIWARQDSGGNLDISGDVNDTYATFLRLM